MQLLDCYLLDQRTVVLTVREQHAERRWFRTVTTEEVKRYVLALRVERWLDGDHYVLLPDPRHFRLWELFAAWRVSQKFNAVVDLPVDRPLLNS